MTRAHLASAMLLLLAVATGCGTDPTTGPGGDDVRQGEEALSAQRDAVRTVAVDVLGALRTAVPGRSANESRTYDACASSGLESYGSFRYTVGVRWEVTGGAPRPYLDAVETAYAGLGLEVERRDVPGGASISGTRDDVTATIAEREVAGDVLVVSVSGPCVETDAGDSDSWLREQDPEPLPAS